MTAFPPDPTDPIPDGRDGWGVFGHEPPGVHVVDSADYRLVLTLTNDGFLSLRHKMSRGELAALLVQIRDVIVAAPGIHHNVLPEGDPT